MKSYLFVAAFSGLVFVYGQSAGGSAGGAAGGAAGGGAVGSGAAGAVGAGGAAAGARAGGAFGGAATGIGAQSTTIGAPSAPAPLSPGSVQAPGIAAPRGTASSAISTPGNLGGGTAVPSSINGQSVAFNTLPAAVQSALRTQVGNTGVSPITQVMTANGPVYTTSINRNGQLMQIALNPNGTMLNPGSIPALQQNTAVTTTTPTGGAANPNTGLNNTALGVNSGNLPGSASASGVATAEAGIPLSSLPATIQNTLRSQLPNAAVQTVSRDNTPNGTLYRVTVDQNGVPTELRFAANGSFLGSTPINGSLTAPVAPLAGGGLATGTESRSAVGNAPATQQGSGTVPNQIQPNAPANNRVVPLQNRSSTNRSETIRSGDLPKEVSAALGETVKGDNVRVVRRDTDENGENRYFVGFIEEGSYNELELSADGEILRDSRKTGDVKVTIVGRATPDENRTVLDYPSLPVAVRRAVQAYAEPGQVRSARLTRDRDGSAAFEVVIYADGRRDRLMVGKDGTVSRYEENVPVSAEVSGVDRSPVLAIGDLPQQVQDTIRRQTDTVRIEEIKTAEIGGNTVYQVSWQTNGTPAELLVAGDGALIYPTGSAIDEAAGGELPLPDENEPEVVRAVTETKPDEASGAAALAATGTATSVENASTLAETNNVDLKSVRLEEAPEAVQNTIKQLGGTASIESISPTVGDSGIEYSVTYMLDGTRKTMHLNKEGQEVEK